MADWQQYTQSVIFGFIFSFMLAKLFSIILSFRDENLQITRDDSEPPEPRVRDSDDHLGESKAEIRESNDGLGVSDAGTRESRVSEGEIELVNANENERLLDENAKLVSGNVYESDSDSDWEGVESTELDELFSAATAFVAATAADKSSQKVSNELQLQLYGLYKIATEGPCTAPQPSALKMTARAKWQAWQKLGAMPPEEAMEKYIEIVTDLYPTWADGSTSKRKLGDAGDSQTNESRPMGPVFSTFVYEEESGNELKLDAIHGYAREGELENMLKCIESGVSVDLKDSEGRTPLHWAVDRGHLDVAELLISRNADLNLKDNEGQTPLHYAAVCGREAIAELLVKRNADVNVKDDDGNLPSDICDSKWPWLQPQ